MKAKYLFLALSAIALATSCSNDEVTEVSDSNAIKFSVSTGKMNRAADVYCSNNLPKAEGFYVWATYDDATYIDGDYIKYQTNAWENMSGLRYWPDNGTVDFYAHVHAGDAFNWNNGAPKIENFTVEQEVANQVDLLYAVTKGQSKANQQTSGVNMNFRHALSQIVFKAKNTNPNLYVKIYGVKVCNVGNTNTYTYPKTNDTSEKYVNHDGIETPENTYTKGEWAKLIAGTADYQIGWGTAVELPGDQTNPVVKDLYASHAEGKEFSTDAMLLLPQTSTAWVPGAESTNPEEDGATGSAFLVKCNIYNVAGDTYADGSDVLLWGNEESGKEGKYVAIPMTLNWEEGKKYIYTFVFGDGNGGYDPEIPNNPVLFPITFTVSVDDFDPVVQPDVDMTTK